MTCRMTLHRSFAAGLAVAVLAALVLLQPVVAHATNRGSTPGRNAAPDDDGDAKAAKKPAAEPPAQVAPAREQQPWQFQLHERTKQLQLGWIIPAAIFDGGGRAVWWSLGSTEGPWLLPVIIGVQTIEGCGIIASQAELKRIHRWIDEGRSAMHLSRRLENQGWRWFGVSMGCLALGWIWYGLYTAAWDFGMMISAVMAWLLVFPFLHPAITYFGAATDAKRVANGHVFSGEGNGEARRRRPRAEVKAFSPMGIVIVW